MKSSVPASHGGWFELVGFHYTALGAFVIKGLFCQMGLSFR